MDGPRIWVRVLASASPGGEATDERQSRRSGFSGDFGRPTPNTVFWVV
jgi:hypothetical protein